MLVNKITLISSKIRQGDLRMFEISKFHSFSFMELSTKVWSLTSEKVSRFRQAVCDRPPWNGCKTRLSKDHDFKIFLASKAGNVRIAKPVMRHDATKRPSVWLPYNTQHARTSRFHHTGIKLLFTDTVTTAFDSRAQCPSRLNVSAGASVSSDNHGFGPRNCLSSSDSS